MVARAPALARSARALVLCTVAALAPAPALGQTGCIFGEGSAEARFQVTPQGDTLRTTKTPHLECDDDVEIWADSTTTRRGLSTLYGHVRYLDRQRELRADFARYYTQVGRLEAQGHLLVTNHEDGSTVENGDLDYLRQTDTRDIEEMTFTTGSDGLRPRARVYPTRAPPEEVEPPDSTAAGSIQQEPALPAPAEPSEPEQYVVVSDKIVFRGDSYFNATGTVEIQRDSLFAYADSAEYDGDSGELQLDGNARIEGSSYDLVGRRIALVSGSDGTDEVRALREAVLNGEDLRVTAPQIRLYLTDGELERMVAVPLPEEDTPDASVTDTTAAPQPYAISEDVELTGDSLDLAAPGGTLDRIFAAGRARSVSEGRPELNVASLPPIAQTDWIEADTIEVMLVPSPDSAETGDDYQVDRIIATGRARSLYRLTPSDSTLVIGVDPPAISYLVARQITIFMVDGQADRVESVDDVNGWHLEPLKRQPADSTATPPDSTGVTRDAPTVDAALPASSTDAGGDGPPPVTYFFPASRPN